MGQDGKHCALALFAAVRQSSVMRASSARLSLPLALASVLSLGTPAAPRALRSVTMPSTLSTGATHAYKASHLYHLGHLDHLGHVGPAFCPRGTMPDGDACVHLPGEADEADDLGAPDPESSVNTHRDSMGRWVV